MSYHYAQIGVYLAAYAVRPGDKRHRAPSGYHATGGAAIVHHGSIDGVLGNPTLVAYTASKGGLQPLTHVMGYWHGTAYA